MASAAPPGPDDFRRVMARWATGVSVVTARDGVTDAGLTVNGFLSISLRPPSVLVSLTEDVDTLPVLERSGWFGVNFLAADQRALSDRFARNEPSETKFRDLPIHRAPHGTPLLGETLGALECRVVARTPVSDHVLVVGEVTYLEAGRNDLPLVFFRSAYAAPEGSDRLKFPAGRP